MRLRTILLICSLAATAIGDEDIITRARPGDEYVAYESSLGGQLPVQGRAIPIEEFVTAHKIPEGVPKPTSDEDADDEFVETDETLKPIGSLEKLKGKNSGGTKKFQDTELAQEATGDHRSSYDKVSSKRQARVELESFSDSGVLAEEGIRKIEGIKSGLTQVQGDEVLPGVQISRENPTTMVPILTTPREVRSFDFVPVNIIREDSKAYTSYADRNFEDLGDVSLVPAGSNSRIQVKKGPNGKDYEYEYVYYYYDEDDEGKAGSQTNAHDGPARTTAAPRRGLPNGRNKYTSIDRTTTIEPAANEVIPSKSGSRSRQLGGDETTEERLPADTRFPPRSRSNHNTGTTEPSRARGNRPRPSLDLVDSSSFRTHQEGPEFPQSLPKGPVRFLGVTPNEDTEDRPILRSRGRPSKVTEPAPVEEAVDEPVVPSHRRRPIATKQPEVEVELSRGQQSTPQDEESEATPDPAATSEVAVYQKDANTETDSKVEEDTPKEEDKRREDDEKPESVSSDVTDTTTTEISTTTDPAAMDKAALDLYAFQQQEQNSLIDSTTIDAESDESTTVSSDEDTTDVPTTTEALTTTTEPTTTTTTEPTTTTTTTEATTPAAQSPFGRGKPRRPGFAPGAGSRNRFKSGGSSSTTTEASSGAEPTQRPRGRFGSSGSGFKRPRPGQRQPVDEDVQKESAAKDNSERPSAPGRNRFRGTGSRNSVSTTAAPSTVASSASASSSTVARPAFNRLNINRRRGRPTTQTPTTSEEVAAESGETTQPDSQEASTTAKPSLKPRLPGIGPRPLRPGPRINLRLRPGITTSTTLAPETSEATADEPTGAGTEEESREAPAESSPPTPSTTSNPLTRLKSRNRLQVQPKAPRVTVPPAPRRSPLLPRRRTTEAPAVVETSSESASSEEEESEPTETAAPETSTAASQKQEEVRGLSSLLAPRRRIAPRRPGQIISRE